MLKIAKLPGKRRDLAATSLATFKPAEKNLNFFSLRPSLSSPGRTEAAVPRSGGPAAGARDRHGTATREHSRKLHAPDAAADS